jgi:hypothetical protein
LNTTVGHIQAVQVVICGDHVHPAVHAHRIVQPPCGPELPQHPVSLGQDLVVVPGEVLVAHVGGPVLVERSDCACRKKCCKKYGEKQRPGEHGMVKITAAGMGVESETGCLSGCTVTAGDTGGAPPALYAHISRA